MANFEILIVLIWANLLWNLFTISCILILYDIFWKGKKDEEIEKNNVVEFVWEDSEWNWLYRIK